MTPSWRDQRVNVKPRPAPRRPGGAGGPAEWSVSGVSIIHYAGAAASPPPGRGEWGGFLLAWAAALAFCAGLVGLAASPRFGAEAPRWFILAYGVGCALLALLAAAGRRTGVLGFPEELFWPIRKAVQISSGRDPGGSAEKGPQESPSEGAAQFRGRSRPWRDWRAGDGGGTLPAPGGVRRSRKGQL